MTTLAEHIIVVGAENRPLMLEKSMYDSWASRIRLFIKGNKNGRMMLDSIDNGLLVYPTVEENRQTRPKKYTELTEAQQLQDDCDVQATNIILHGLLPDVYALVNHQEAAKDIWDRVKLLMKGTELSYQEHECRLYNLFDKFAYVQVIMEYLVNISKRRAFWSLNEDILKITILKTNTPYPSRKIRRIRACTHQRPQRNEAQYVETATYGKIRVDDDLHDLRYVEAEFPAIVIDDAFAPQDALSCKSQVSTPVNDEIDFRISFNKSDDDIRIQKMIMKKSLYLLFRHPSLRSVMLMI
ncbi:hypothetical protein Tco_0942881 [Tanacetum coccineum]